MIICLCTSPTGRAAQITLGIADLRQQGQWIREAAYKLSPAHTSRAEHKMHSLDQIANVLIDLADWADGKISEDMIGLP